MDEQNKEARIKIYQHLFVHRSENIFDKLTLCEPTMLRCLYREKNSSRDESELVRLAGLWNGTIGTRLTSLFDLYTFSKEQYYIPDFDNEFFNTDKMLKIRRLTYLIRGRHIFATRKLLDHIIQVPSVISNWLKSNSVRDFKIRRLIYILTSPVRDNTDIYMMIRKVNTRGRMLSKETGETYLPLISIFRESTGQDQDELEFTCNDDDNSFAELTVNALQSLQDMLFHTDFPDIIGMYNKVLLDTVLLHLFIYMLIIKKNNYIDFVNYLSLIASGGLKYLLKDINLNPMDKYIDIAESFQNMYHLASEECDNIQNIIAGHDNEYKYKEHFDIERILYAILSDTIHSAELFCNFIAYKIDEKIRNYRSKIDTIINSTNKVLSKNEELPMLQNLIKNAITNFDETLIDCNHNIGNVIFYYFEENKHNIMNKRGLEFLPFFNMRTNLVKRLILNKLMEFGNYKEYLDPHMKKCEEQLIVYSFDNISAGLNSLLIKKIGYRTEDIFWTIYKIPDEYIDKEK